MENSASSSPPLVLMCRGSESETQPTIRIDTSTRQRSAKPSTQRLTNVLKNGRFGTRIIQPVRKLASQPSRMGRRSRQPAVMTETRSGSRETVGDATWFSCQQSANQKISLQRYRRFSACCDDKCPENSSQLTTLPKPIHEIEHWNENINTSRSDVPKRYV